MFSNGLTTTFNNIIWVDMGFNNVESVLFSLPTYAMTFVSVIISGLIVYKWPKTRFPISVFFLVPPTISLLYMGIASNADKWSKWGIYNMNLLYAVSTFVLVWPMMSYNVAGRTKKSFFGASNLFSYCVGNIVGTQIIRRELSSDISHCALLAHPLASQAPKYIMGLSIAAACMFLCILLTIYWWWYYIKENKRRDHEFEASGLSIEEREHLNRVAGETDMTDMEVSMAAGLGRGALTSTEPALQVPHLSCCHRCRKRVVVVGRK